MGDSDEGASAADAGVRGDPSTQCCTACGSTIETDDWYPISKERDGDGDLHIHPFCSEDCKDAWVGDPTA